VIALQALTEYAFRARLKDITDMSITLELPSTAGFRKTVHVDNTSFSDLQMFEVGHIQIFYTVVIVLQLLVPLPYLLYVFCLLNKPV
jgi:hypothetical protein